VLEAGEPERPALVLVHGYPNTKELWQAAVAALADRLHVIAYDVRGAGESSAPRALAAYDFERLGDDFEAVIEATAPGRKIHLVGRDWGRSSGLGVRHQSSVPRSAGVVHGGRRAIA
jgi:pimeloyl-ACP methyl ester carboxylesterase